MPDETIIFAATASNTMEKIPFEHLSHDQQIWVVASLLLVVFVVAFILRTFLGYVLGVSDIVKNLEKIEKDLKWLAERAEIEFEKGHDFTTKEIEGS